MVWGHQERAGALQLLSPRKFWSSGDYQDSGSMHTVQKLREGPPRKSGRPRGVMVEGNLDIHTLPMIGPRPWQTQKNDAYATSNTVLPCGLNPPASTLQCSVFFFWGAKVKLRVVLKLKAIVFSILRLHGLFHAPKDCQVHITMVLILNDFHFGFGI